MSAPLSSLESRDVENSATLPNSNNDRRTNVPAVPGPLAGPSLDSNPGMMSQWKIQDAYETYGVRNWGKGYFAINDKGNVVVHPNKKTEEAIDLKELVDQLQERGIQLPILLRFTDILRHRVCEIYEAFTNAVKEFAYQGTYCCVYPIKVNQQRHVVEEILDVGKQYHFGLEAGSKPELLAVLAMTNGGDTPIICNGFKDDEFIKMTILARKMGKHIIPVVEKFTELEMIVKYAQELNVKPIIGIRVKLAAKGGRPLAASVPELSFQVRPDPHRGSRGVRVPGRNGGMEDCLQLVHTSIWDRRSPNIRSIKNAPHRGGPDLLRAASRRRRRQVHRRRRRPRHRLRRLADRLRIVGQLHAAGSTPTTIVQRIKAVCDEDRACRIRRSSANRAGPWSRITACSSSTSSASPTSTATRCRRRSPADAPAADRRSLRHLPRPVRRRTCSRATTTRSRRWTNR